MNISNSALRFLVRRLLLLLIAVFLLPAFSWASPNPKFNPQVFNPHLLRLGMYTGGDLDGDKINDVASGVKVGQSTQGYVYRVDLDLSSGSTPSSFLVYSKESVGLTVDAVDLDGDNDLDLVLTGLLAEQPSVVWINDGKGHFSEGDPTRYEVGKRQRHESLVSVEMGSPSASLPPRQLRVVREDSCAAQSLPSGFRCYSPIESSKLSSDLSDSVRDRAPPALRLF